MIKLYKLSITVSCYRNKHLYSYTHIYINRDIIHIQIREEKALKYSFVCFFAYLQIKAAKKEKSRITIFVISLLVKRIIVCSAQSVLECAHERVRNNYPKLCDVRILLLVGFLFILLFAFF